jgi:cell division protein FtsB
MLSLEQWLAVIGVQATFGIAAVGALLAWSSRIVRLEEQVKTLRRDVNCLENEIDEIDRAKDSIPYKARKKRQNDWPSPSTEKSEEAG